MDRSLPLIKTLDTMLHLRVSPCQLGQKLHPTSQNSSIFNFYDPFSGVRDTVNFYCSIPISLEMTAF